MRIKLLLLPAFVLTRHIEVLSGSVDPRALLHRRSDTGHYDHIAYALYTLDIFDKLARIP